MPEFRPLRIGIWLVTVGAIVTSLFFLALRLTAPGDGATVAFYAGSWTADGVRVQLLPGPSTGLRDGDLVTAVEGRSLGEWIDRAVDPSIERPGGVAGQTVDYTVLRDGSTIRVPVALAPHDSGGILRDYWSALLLIVVLEGLAVFVLARRPDDGAAIALAVAAVGVTASTVAWMLGTQVSDIARGWPFVLYAAAVGGVYMVLFPAGALHLPLALTSGAPIGRRTLAAIYGVPLGTYALAVAAARLATPSATAWVGTWPVLQGLVVVPTLLAGLPITLVRYRRADPAARARIRWVAIGGLTTVVASLTLMTIPQLVTGRPLIPWSAVGLVALPLPIGIAAAILRYRLFDIDVVVNRALVYGGATASIVLIYVVAVSLLGRLLGVQAGFSSSILATGLAAVAALPIRDALQRVVNRLMYGDRDDPYRALVRLGRRLEATLDPLEAPTVIVRTVAESLRLPWVALRVGAGDDGRLIVHGTRPPGGIERVPLVFGAEQVGELQVAPRSATEALSAADRKLLDGLAPAAGAAVHALALTLDLLESRERLVATREEERRRIRRDLHDGLGPTLAAIGLRAELAADLATRDGDAAGRVLAEMRDEVRSALADVRRLVDGLRPPALDELGLVGALEAQAIHLGPEPSVGVEAASPLPELPAAVEVAAYRIAAEAMTNAARHSGATVCTVRLGELDGAERVLEIVVTDDGRGLGADARPGIGLVSMRQRASEVGGTCEIGSAPGGGTVVHARLPLGESRRMAEAPGA